MYVLYKDNYRFHIICVLCFIYESICPFEFIVVDVDVTSNASVGSPSPTPVTNIVPKILLENQNRRTTTLTALEDEINKLTKNVNSSLHIKKSPTMVTRKNVASDENRSNSSNDRFRIRLPDGISYWQTHNTYLPPQLTRTKSTKYSKPTNRHYF